MKQKAEVILFKAFEQSPQMQKIVQAWFATNLNYSRTAKATFTHPNTVRYWLAQVQKKTGYDLTQLSDVVLVY